MSPTSVLESRFRSCVARWIAASDEVLVCFRYANSGGLRHFEFAQSMAAFDARIQSLPADTSVVVFEQRVLPLTGPVDPSFVAQALDLVPDGREYLIVELYSPLSGTTVLPEIHSGESHVELTRDLHSLVGHLVSVGPYPPWWHSDGDHLISAYVPRKDGTVSPGAY